MPSNAEYPCPRCHQGHCVCDQSAIRTRVFRLEEFGAVRCIPTKRLSA